MTDFFNSYYKTVCDSIAEANSDILLSVSRSIREANDHSGKVIIVGNGGSAAIASHTSIDLTKAANIRSINFNESSLLTCLSNDYGYESWVEKALEFYADQNDILILISSSGQSKNIINGATKAKEMKLPLITLSGFTENNPLRSMGDINLWVASSNYNVVETTHQVWLLSIVDYLIENKR